MSLVMLEFDIKKFLETPIDAFDFQFMIADVKDFLEFSESKIDLHYRNELQCIAHREDLDDFPPEYQYHLEQNADHRFKVRLPLRVRYGALLTFITSVEWAVALLNKCSKNPAPKKKKVDKTNLTVHILRQLSSSTCVDPRSVIDDYEALVQIRNCIAHSAGVVATYEHKVDMPKSVARIEGVSIENWHFLGDQICIERGALEGYIDQTASLVVELHSKMRSQGLLE